LAEEDGETASRKGRQNRFGNLGRAWPLKIRKTSRQIKAYTKICTNTPYSFLFQVALPPVLPIAR
jgi:hypothetical protein